MKYKQYSRLLNRKIMGEGAQCARKDASTRKMGGMTDFSKRK